MALYRDQGVVLRRSGERWIMAARRTTFAYLSAGLVRDDGQLFVAGGGGTFGLAALEEQAASLMITAPGRQAGDE